MKKFDIAQAPETFFYEVILDQHDGSQASITVEYYYRSRTGLAKFIDDNLAASKKRQEAIQKAVASGEARASKDESETLQSIIQKQNELAIDDFLKIAKSWDLVEKFDKENLLKFYDRYAYVFNKIESDYQSAIWTCRLKN